MGASSDKAWPADGENSTLFLPEEKLASIRLFVLAEAGQQLPLDFGDWPHQATFAANSDSMQAAFKQNQFDVALLAMPIGTEDARILLNDMVDEGCRWLLLGDVSGDATPALRTGAFAILKPPYDADQLATLCRSACLSAQLQRSQAYLQDRLSSTTTMLKAITEYSDDMLYVLDQDGRFLLTNNRFESLLGYGSGDLIGRRYDCVIDPDDLDVARHVFGKRRRDADSYLEVEIRLRPAETALTQNRAIKVQLISRGIYADQPQAGQFLGMYGVVRLMVKKDAAGRLDDGHLHLYQDALTALPNRTLFKDRLAVAISQVKRKQRQLAVMFLDLEKFKQVNDNFGHPCGDQVLRMVASRLRSHLRSGDTLARFGGDEFMFLLPDIDGQKDTTAIARKLIKSLREPFRVDDKEISIGCSIGIALYPDADLYPEEEDPAEAVLNFADMAMYRAKRSSRQKYRVFSKSMTQRMASRLQVEKDLRVALVKNQIETMYRPRWSLETGSVVAVEAGFRWHHPERGLVPYGNFLSVAEQTGLITNLNEQAWEQASKEMLRWENQGLPDIQLSLKLSGAQVWQHNFPQAFLNTIRNSHLSPSKVTVEIDEETVMQDIETLAPKLRSIGRAGMALIIGQFGAGYFSLFHAQKFPIYALRVDDIFTREILGTTRDKTLAIRGIVAMAKALDIKVIADGVEASQQLAYLKDIGCDEVQGFFFGSSRSATEMVELLQRQSRMF